MYQSHQGLYFIELIIYISTLHLPLYAPCLSRYHHHYLSSQFRPETVALLSASWSPHTWKSPIYVPLSVQESTSLPYSQADHQLSRLESELFPSFKLSLSNQFLTVAYKGTYSKSKYDIATFQPQIFPQHCIYFRVKSNHGIKYPS